MPQALTRISSALHPIMFAVFPLLSLFVQNQSEVELSVLWWPLLVSVGVAAALYGLFLLLTKRGTKAGALASLVVIAFFYYGTFSDAASGAGLSGGVLLASWAAALAAGVILVVRTGRKLDNLTVIVTVGAAVLALYKEMRVR